MSYEDLKATIERLGVHPALGPTGQGWGIEQNPHELATFLTETADAGIRSVLEVGTGYKAGLARFMQAVLGWQVVTVDIVNYGHAFPGITFVIDHEGGAAEQIGDRAFDLVLLDADHTYDGTKAAFELYGPLGRIVALHDIAGLRDCEGVARFWEAISRTKKLHNLRKYHYEVIAEDDFRAGIGWIDK